MGDNSELGSIQKCRLRGVNGFHELDILENCSSSGLNNENELSQKIFQCVGIWVERNDKLTSKICGNCVAKINEFVAFRKICAATDVQLKIALSNVMGYEPLSMGNSNAMLEVANDTRNSSIESVPMIGKDVAAVTHMGLVVDDVEMNDLQTMDPLAKAEIAFDCEEIAQVSFSSPFVRLEKDASIPQRNFETTASATATACTTSPLDDEEDCNVGAKTGSTKKQNNASNKTNANNWKFKVNCNERNCKEIFDSRTSLVYHVNYYHAKGIKKNFECHLCKRSFPVKRDFRRHFDAVHSALKPFKCANESCLKLFSRKGNLMRHIETVHLGLKPFQCPNQKCSKRFTLKGNLKRHVDSVHSGHSNVRSKVA